MHTILILISICFSTMQTETVTKKINDCYQVILDSRGSTGLQLCFRIDNKNIASISREETIKPKNLKPGDSIKAIFNIIAKARGTAKITFYETQPWNKNFTEILIKELVFKVE